ncbi:hypothetical protein ABIB29_003649 [Arthrobacter sp. UYEF36]
MTRPQSPERPGRVFLQYSKWPLVPAEDLLKLRHALLLGQKLGGPDVADDLLALVDQEVRLHGLAPPTGGSSGAGTGTE